MLADKYKPKKVTDIIGHKRQINKIIKWIKNWKKEKYKALLFNGPPGIGKTSCAHVIAKEFGLEIVETNASDKRSAGAIKGLFVTVKSQSLFNKKGKILIMDEVDGMSAGDRGGVAEIRKLIEATKCPIICIANDIIGPKLAPLRKVAEKINFHPPSPDLLLTKMTKIFPKIQESKMRKIILSSMGDIRNIFNTIQINLKKCEKDKNTDIDVVDAVKLLINQKDLTSDQKRSLFYTNYQLMPLYIHQLYPSYIGNIKELADASNDMSMTDVYNEPIIKEQKWEFLKYIEQLTVNVAGKGGQFKGFMQFPQFFPKLSKTNKYKRILKSTGLDPDSLSVIYQKYLKKLVSGNVTDDEIENIIAMIDKDDIYDLLEHFYQEKVPTKLKRKITSIYKKNTTIVGIVKEKGKRKRKIEIKK
jgi:replication factor C subunit 1